MIVLVLFDGCCEPNPDGIACFGFSIRGDFLKLDQPVVGNGVIGAGKGQTNNIAEYTALGKALAWLVANAKVSLKPDDEIVMCGDSKLVIDQLTGRAACNAEPLKPLLDQCKDMLRALGCRWKAEWIPRAQNVEADLLTRAAYTGRTGKPFPERAKGS